MTTKKYFGTCHCGEKLQREATGPDDYYICCPRSHNEPDHVCYLEGDRE
jgi:hypothetical protein